jgi:hypothetical protein
VTAIDPGDFYFSMKNLATNQDESTEHDQGGHTENNRLVAPPTDRFLSNVRRKNY